jgi:hypothetical protein
MGVKLSNYLRKRLKSALISLMQTFCSNEVLPTRRWPETGFGEMSGRVRSDDRQQQFCGLLESSSS